MLLESERRRCPSAHCERCTATELQPCFPPVPAGGYTLHGTGADAARLQNLKDGTSVKVTNVLADAQGREVPLTPTTAAVRPTLLITAAQWSGTVRRNALSYGFRPIRSVFGTPPKT